MLPYLHVFRIVLQVFSGPNPNLQALPLRVREHDLPVLAKLVRELSFLVYLIKFISDFLVHIVQVLLLVRDLPHLGLRLSELVILIGHEGRCAIGYSCQDNVLAHVY